MLCSNELIHNTRLLRQLQVTLKAGGANIPKLTTKTEMSRNNACIRRKFNMIGSPSLPLVSTKKGAAPAIEQPPFSIDTKGNVDYPVLLKRFEGLLGLLQGASSYSSGHPPKCICLT